MDFTPYKLSAEQKEALKSQLRDSSLVVDRPAFEPISIWYEIYVDTILQSLPAIWQHKAGTGEDISDEAIAFAANLADKAVAVAKERGQ